MKILYRFLLYVIVFGIFSSCQEEKNKNLITIGFVSWEENVALANLTKILLEQEGYTVKYRHADIQPIFSQLLPKGKIDIFMDAWLPQTHKEYMKQHGEDLEIIGSSYKEAKTGLVVPSYVNLRSIEELNAHKDQFHRRITGIDAGAGIMKNTEEAIKAYQLDLELIPSTNFAMASALRSAIQKKEWIVVTGWTPPHSLFAEFDLKFLDDPLHIYSDKEQIYTIARQGFSSDYPRAKALLKNIKLNDQEIADLLATIKNAKHDFEGAEEWIGKNPAIIKKWKPDKTLPLKVDH